MSFDLNFDSLMYKWNDYVMPKVPKQLHKSQNRPTAE